MDGIGTKSDASQALMSARSDLRAFAGRASPLGRVIGIQAYGPQPADGD
jgi:hypothetical protein